MTYQQNLFYLIKSCLAPNKNLYQEVSNALSIGYDSARRRVLLITAITFEEACKLKEYFKVTLDNVSTNSETPVNFDFKKFNESNLYQFLNLLNEQLSELVSIENNKVTFTAKDLPFSYHTLVPELFVFKLYYYIQIMWPDSKIKNQKFDYASINLKLEHSIKDFERLSHTLKENFTKINSLEIWNKNTLNSDLENILYSWESGYFKDEANALLILDKLELILDHIKKETINGRKLPFEKIDDKTNYGTLDLYFSEGMALENTYLVDSDGHQKIYLLLNYGDCLTTVNQDFCKRGIQYIENLKTHSNPISKVSEKTRNRFFFMLKQKIDNAREKIKKSTLI